MVRCTDEGTVGATLDGLESGRSYKTEAVSGMVAPPPQTVTPWLDLPPAPLLQAALGVLRQGPGSDVPVTFRIGAENPDGSRATVGSWTRRPGEGEWRSIEVPLAGVRRRLGPRVRLVLDTTSLDTDRGMVFPM
jgi:hypothetical protein